MNQKCKVCGEPAAGFHFGAFTCEGCKSFFGRSYNNISSITECKNNGECIINKKNRTACKACRLRKCLLVGMSKSGSRYGRRSNWFKIHCLLQEQQQAAMASLRGKASPDTTFSMGYPPPFMHPETPSSISSPDSESSDSSPHPYLPVHFSPMFMRPPPFLLHPPLFPFATPPLKPEPPLTPSEEDSPIKPSRSPILNNNYDSKNNNLEKNSKRFYLDAILGLNGKGSPPPATTAEDRPDGQDNPIDLSVRGRSPRRPIEETKTIPLDLSV